MADGFKKMEVSDPSSLTDFIEATSGSILSIISVSHHDLKVQYPFYQSLNNVLYNNNPDDIPITDLDAAASLPYDTDIPEVKGFLPPKKLLLLCRATPISLKTLKWLSSPML